MGAPEPVGEAARGRAGLPGRTWHWAARIIGAILAVVPAVSAAVQIQDLGSLGGGYTRARAVNNQGLIVGEALLPIAGTVEHGFSWQNGLMTDLGTLGGLKSRALDVNAAGAICGWAQDAAGLAQPVLWNSSSIQKLDTLGGSLGAAWAVNDLGTAVGHSYLDNSLYHASLWQGGTVSDLGTLGGQYSIAYDINRAGVVGGAADDLAKKQQACLWTAQGPMNLGNLSGGEWNAVRAVNDQGQMILWGLPAGSADNHAALWNGNPNSPVTDLGTLGGGESWAYGLNNDGAVVGWAELEAGNYHAFAYDGQAMTDLGTLGGLFSSAYGINDQGLIVGYAQDGTGIMHAVQWTIVPEPSCQFFHLSLGLAVLWLVRCRGKNP